MKRKFPNQLTQNIPYSEILKALRDQILSSIFISIATDNSDQANKIFEILNARGVDLEDSELLKNYIFKYLQPLNPRNRLYGIFIRPKRRQPEIRLAARPKARSGRAHHGRAIQQKLEEIP